jgi:hypothetical protein
MYNLKQGELKMKKLTYTVYYLQNNELVQHYFSTFAQAAGCAGALTGLRYINAKLVITDKDGGYYSEEGCLYKYAAGQSERTACNKSFITKISQIETGA